MIKYENFCFHVCEEWGANPHDEVFEIENNLHADNFLQKTIVLQKFFNVPKDVA